MPDKPYPPGPPPIPRCPECDHVVMYRGHAPDCQRGQEQAMRAEQQHAIEDALVAAVRERRQDTAFMDRLAARIAADGVILDRLARVD